MKMMKMPKNKRAASICNEWAEDFKQKKMFEEVGYWTGISLAFKAGTEINYDAITQLKDHLTLKLSGLEKMVEFSKGTEMEATIEEIFSETRFLIKALGMKDESFNLIERNLVADAIRQRWKMILDQIGEGNISKKTLLSYKYPNGATTRTLENEIKVIRNKEGELEKVIAVAVPSEQSIWDSFIWLRVGDCFLCSGAGWAICEDDTLLLFD